MPIHRPSSLATSEEIQPFGSVCVVAAIVAQLAEFVAVEAIESVLGAEPHEAFAVLDDGIHRLLRQTFLEAVALHAERRSGERRRAKTRRRARRSRRARTDLTGLVFPRVIDIVEAADDSSPHRSGRGPQRYVTGVECAAPRRAAVERYHSINVMRVTAWPREWT